jgi:predicted transposase YdaD
MAIVNPHDTFFESVFSVKENAIAHLEVVLPPRLGKNIDLKTINIDKKSYLDDELKKYYSDIVYTGYYKIGHPWPIFLLDVAARPVRQL